MHSLLSLLVTFCTLNLVLTFETAHLSTFPPPYWLPNHHVLQKRSLDTKKLIDEESCADDIKRICGVLPPGTDDLTVLECIQTYKPVDGSELNEQCQHSVWSHTVSLLGDSGIKEATQRACSIELGEILSKCDSDSENTLGCLLEHKDELQSVPCKAFIQRIGYIAFSDYRLLPKLTNKCQKDIDKHSCGRLQSGSLSQGKTLACLQTHLDDLDSDCHRHVLKISEQQADDIKLDRQLFLACAADLNTLCPNIPTGTSQAYKCLMHRRLDRTMSRMCAEQLARRQKLISADFKVSRGLARACKDDIRTYHCRRDVSDDKDIRLSQILLCLEGAMHNGSKVSLDCQQEMLDHRKILLEDFHLSPEIVSGCAEDIKKFCDNGVQVGGKTIHCLMEHTRVKKKKERISPQCQRALEMLVQETDAGEDWRVDPILREACQPVVDAECSNVRGGDARVITCLMSRIGTKNMRAACEAALLQIQFFVARDYKLDPPLYRECREDAIKSCHAKKSWSDDPNHMDPQRGPLVLPCLYRLANQDDNAVVKLKSSCEEELRRVMRQRAVSVDLEPDVQDNCLDDLAYLCPLKTGRGEETQCLQDNLDKLISKCKDAIINLTEQQAEHIELNPIISENCAEVLKKHCEQEMKDGKDEGDLIECLIKHKNEPEVRQEHYKCRAAVEHFQLISMKNYKFTFKFKQACKPYVARHCSLAMSKADVITCLSEIVRNATLLDQKHAISRDCRQQLRAQLLQQHENIEFDPKLKAACGRDIEEHCSNVVAGGAQVLECLQKARKVLSPVCHKSIFKVERQQLTDSAVDYALLNGCQHDISHFCHDVSLSQALECLKQYKNEAGLDPKCRALILRRMVEQSEDYRLNPALQQSCRAEIRSLCSDVIAREPADQELEGKVVKCLKGKYREKKLSVSCARQITEIMREAALNYKLNPSLARSCKSEINSQCRPSGASNGDEGGEASEEDIEDGTGSVEECLKQLLSKNKITSPACRLEVASLVEEEKVDIHTDPLLHQACKVDLEKFCADVVAGGGKQIECLQSYLQDTRRVLEPKCKSMLLGRMAMFRSAEMIIAPENMQELYQSVAHSKEKHFFLVVSLAFFGTIFFFGMFCGRVTRRHTAMKNK
ncbi:Golgi apparatus protein 1 [Cloeon dipterum]|uniref:Golgi apparatus protein 1 n=1 Tax=Cloeon dipterum TaxID=197152 RepID=UPI00321F89C0